jgi:hypothetical protein
MIALQNRKTPQKRVFTGLKLGLFAHRGDALQIQKQPNRKGSIMPKEFYTRRATQDMAVFVDNLKDAARDKDGRGHVMLDSVSAESFVAEAQSRSNVLPEQFQILRDEAGKDAIKITRAMLDGISAYEAAHGGSAPADLVEYALHCG